MNSVYQNLIIQKVQAASNVFFHDHTMIVLTQHELKNEVKHKRSASPSNIVSVIGIQRNPVYKQIYVVPKLERSLHFAAPTSEFNAFVSSPYPSLDPSNESSHRAVAHTFIPFSANYMSQDGSMYVNNHSATDTYKHEGCPHKFPDSAVETCNQEAIKMFTSGIASAFCFNEKKRSGTSNTGGHDEVEGSCAVSFKSVTQSCNGTSAKFKLRIRKKNQRKQNGAVNLSALPTITLGWSMNDAHQYSSNRSSIVGSIRPFVRDGCLSKTIKQHLLGLVKTAIASLPKECQCFNIEKEQHPFVRKMRDDMIHQFESILGGTDHSEHFRVEGITIIIPLGLGPHRDTLNSNFEFMSSVLQINTSIPISNRTIPDGRSSPLWQWLELNGYSGCFPCSLILYSRKSVEMYCQKMSAMNDFGKRDGLRSLLRWAFIDRVNSDVDFLGSVWYNDDFADRFEQTAIMNKKLSFRGRMMQRTASYDRIVSTQINLYAMFYTIVIMDLTFTYDCVYIRVT